MISSHDFLETRPSLLAALQDGPAGGDELAWREFFALYAPPVFRIARRRGLAAADAEDIVQQVMLAVFEHIERFSYERDRSRFRAWVIRITENKIIDFVRKRKPAVREASALEQEIAPGADAHLQWEQEWRQQDLMYCLEQIAADISPRRMTAFQLYVLQGVPAEETARQLGMSTAYVYVTRNQVLTKLYEQLEKLTKEEDGGRRSDEDGSKDTGSSGGACGGASGGGGRKGGRDDQDG